MTPMERQKLIDELAKKVRAEGFVHSKEKKVSVKNLEKLRKEFGRNKKIPAQYEKLILTALSYFPELKEEKISFFVGRSTFSMETRIKIISVFGNKREYTIKMKKSTVDLYFGEFSAETTVALLCHELSHVVDYRKKSFLGMIKFTLLYLWPSQRQKIELETEIRALYHGTGHFMLVYYDEFMKNVHRLIMKRMSNYWGKYHFKYYLRKNEMKRLMNQSIKDR
jgi:hypothetical protein